MTDEDFISMIYSGSLFERCTDAAFRVLDASYWEKPTLYDRLKVLLLSDELHEIKTSPFGASERQEAYKDVLRIVGDVEP